MNAVINLNHFCEIHGPATIFSTQTLRDKKLITNTAKASSSTSGQCYGCGIGNKIVFLSKADKDSSILFVSSGEKGIIGKDNQGQSSLITLRSLSCEVNEQFTCEKCHDWLLLCFRLPKKDLFTLVTPWTRCVSRLRSKIRLLEALKSFTQSSLWWKTKCFCWTHKPF